jgi:hypothetical protein
MNGELHDVAKGLRELLLRGRDVVEHVVEGRFSVQMCIWEISERTKNLGAMATARHRLAVPGVYWGIDVAAHVGSTLTEIGAFEIARLFAGEAPSHFQSQPTGAEGSLWFHSDEGWTLWQPLSPPDYERAMSHDGPL